MDNNYDAVIFDQDGVLLDSGLNHFLWIDKVRKNAAQNKGYSFTTKDSIKLVKTSSKENVNDLIEEKGMSWSELKDIERKIAEKKIEMIRQNYIHLFPGAHHLLNSLDVPIGMATNATRLSTDFVLDFFSIENYFQTVRTVELEKGRWFECKKPNSTLVEGVKNDLNAENPLMVGDSPSDTKSAKAAGVDSVLIESYSERPELDPTHRVKNLAEVQKFIS